MALYAAVPRDLSRVKSKILFNLTKRQLFCFSLAAIVGLPVFFLTKKTGNVSFASLCMIVVMMPFFLLAMYEKDGEPLEVILWHIIQAKWIRPKIRLYETDTFYEILIRQEELEKEVQHIVFEKETKGNRAKGSGKSKQNRTKTNQKANRKGQKR